jgi:signal transduction histidine kinase
MEQEERVLLITKIADIFISISYFIIPMEMAWFLWRKKLPIRLEIIIILFVLFIFSCGVSHIANIFQNLTFGLIIKVITAVISIITAISLFFIIPALVHLPELIFDIESENKYLLNFRKINIAIRKTLEKESIIQNVLNELHIIYPLQNIQIIKIETNITIPPLLNYQEVGYSMFSSYNDNNIENPLDGTVNINNELKMCGNNLIIKDLEFLTDIAFQIKSALEQAEIINELKISNKELLIAKQTEDEFLSLISHDIKSPLSSIISLLELLEPTEKQKEYTELIYESSDLMFQLINKIVDADKLKNKKVKLENISFDLIKEIEKVINIQKIHILRKKLNIDVNFDPPNFHFNVIGDSLRFSQIILNLLSNAIKFTNINGAVRVNINAVYLNDKMSLIKIEIIDTGIGMTQDTINKIFESFTQSNISTARIYGGSGLGLFICKKLVNLMNGQISVKSTINVGTTFKVEIPFETCSLTK